MGSKPIDAELIQALDASYRETSDIEVPIGDCPESQMYLEQARRYARRIGARFYHRFGIKNGQEYLILGLRPKRAYTKHSEYWETQWQ